MARISYGAAPGDVNPRHDMPGMINLEIVDTLNYERRPVCRNQDYLYTLVSLTVSCVYNPQATSYAGLPPVGANPVKQKGFVAPTTELGVRHFLEQPRRQLVYNVGGVRVLESPRAQFPCDSFNGPFIDVHAVKEIKGVKTFLVTFTLHTAVNECHLRTGNPPAVLSHQWTKERSLDQDYFATVMTRGHVVFDAARLRTAGGAANLDLSPDDYWDALCLPIENGFRRNAVQVVVNEDNLSCDYVVIDREMPLVVVHRGVSRIEAWHVGGIARRGIEEAADDTFESLRRNFNPNQENFNLLNAFGGFILDTFGTAKKALPVGQHTIQASVWGNHSSKRSVLQQVALSIIIAQINRTIVPQSLAMHAFESSIEHDLTGKFVRAQATFKGGPILTLAQNLIGAGDPANLLGQKKPFPAMPILEGFQGILSDQAVANTGPPNIDKPGRGTYLKALVAQVLRSPCASPGAPARARDLDPQSV